MIESGEDQNASPELRYFRREVRGLANHLGLEDPPLQLAEQIFQQGRKTDVPVDSWSRYSAACLLMAAKLQDLPISAERFASGARHPKKSLVRKVQLISNKTGLDVTPRDPEPFLRKYMNELEASNEVRERAFEIEEEAREEVLGSGISPTSYAAAVLYVSSLENGGGLIQKDIAEVSGKSTVTIRNRYQDILDAVDTTPAPRKGRNQQREHE